MHLPVSPTFGKDRNELMPRHNSSRDAASVFTLASRRRYREEIRREVMGAQGVTISQRNQSRVPSSS
jgi:hypothetical protein